MSDQDSTYNGWSNYPTWAVNMWLSNDEGLYHAVNDLLREDETNYRNADCLKSFVEELPEVDAVYSGEASFVTDLLGYALGDVDWLEIVEAWES